MSFLINSGTSTDATSRARVFLLVFAPLLAVYLTTTDYSGNWHNDALTNSFTAWSIAKTGSAHIEAIDGMDLEETWGKVWWFLPGPDGPVSKYPPGAPLTAVPLYSLASTELRLVGAEFEPLSDPDDVITAQLPLPPLWPGAMTAAITTAAAIGLLAVALQPIASGAPQVVGAGLVVGLGTAAWSISSDALWQHGPSLLYLGIAYLSVSARPWRSGIAYGLAILTRPQVAPIAATIGIWMAWKDRSIRRLVAIGIGATTGSVAYLLYAKALIGSWIPSGGSLYFFANLADTGWTAYMGGLLRAFLDPTRGLLVMSPFLIFLGPGLPVAWRTASPLIRSSAVGGVLYFLIQIKGNVWHGGLGHFGYRYPIEMLFAAAPLLFLAYRGWVAGHQTRKRVFYLLATFSAAVHGAGAWIY